MSNKTKIQGHNTALESLKNILAVPMEKHGMYVWRKFTAQGGTFIDFVVSDIESAYPDGGLKDGYWYEKFQLNSLFHCTKVAVDEIVVTTEGSSLNTAITLNHSLGEQPIAYLAFVEEYTPSAQGTYITMQFSVLINGSATTAKCVYLVENTNSANGYGGTYYSGNVNATAETVQVLRVRAGKKITLITMAY